VIGYGGISSISGNFREAAGKVSLAQGEALENAEMMRRNMFAKCPRDITNLGQAVDTISQLQSRLKDGR
jgi:hypothetical protein